MNHLSGSAKPEACARFYARYALCALILIAVLFCFAKFANTLSMLAFSLVLALLTAIATPTFAYVLFATKLHNRSLLSETGFFAKTTRGKAVRIFVSFVLSLAAMVGLLFSVVRWGQAEWTIALVSAAACPFVFMLANKISAHEFNLAFEKTGTLVLGGVRLVSHLPLSLLIRRRPSSIACLNPFWQMKIPSANPLRCCWPMRGC